MDIEPLVQPMNSTSYLNYDYIHDNYQNQNETDTSSIYDEVRELLWQSFMKVSSVLPNNTNDDPDLLGCFAQFVESQLSSDPSLQEGCPVKFDGVSCWPATPPGTLRAIPCFEEFNGLFYDSSENATLYCQEDGIWARKSSYKLCMKAQLPAVTAQEAAVLSSIKLIFYIGNCTSLVAVLLALVIFVSFQDLRCLRNTIHTNLLVSYLLNNTCWVIFASVQNHVAMLIGCSVFVTLQYFTLTNFMWMFVEGLYLYLLVVETFSVNDVKLRIYILIGWGVPMPVTVLWVIVKISVTTTQTGVIGFPGGMEIKDLVRTCPLLLENPVEWIVRTPVLLVLSTNILFLIRIMWVLITKLRSANTVETERYRKATKALLVLIPLFGLTYMLLIALPQELEYLRAVLLSTQGFWVALFYCFLNSEVRNSLKTHLVRWKTNHDFVDGNSRASIRHRENSIAYAPDPIRNNDREYLRTKRKSEISNASEIGNGFLEREISREVIDELSEPNEESYNQDDTAFREGINSSVAFIPQKHFESFRSSNMLFPPQCSESIKQEKKSKPSLFCWKKSKSPKKSLTCSTICEYPHTPTHKNVRNSINSLLSSQLNYTDNNHLNTSTYPSSSPITPDKPNNLPLSSTALCLSPSYLAIQVQGKLDQCNSEEEKELGESSLRKSLQNLELLDDFIESPKIKLVKKSRSLPTHGDEPILLKCKYVTTPV